MSDERDEKKPTIPFKTVSEIVNRTVDNKVKVSKSFVKLIQECGNAFIGQIATEIAIQADNDGVKTIGNKQVYNALSALGFDDMKKEVEKRVSDPETFSKRKTAKKRQMLVIDEAKLNEAKKKKK